MSDDGRNAEPRILSARVPATLYRQLEHDAATLGLSISDVTRFRLLTGRVPTFSLVASDPSAAGSTPLGARLGRRSLSLALA
jgi:hypothetical protein